MEALTEISPTSQDYNIYMLGKLPPKYLLYLNSCGDKMGPSGDECIDDVLREILTNKHASKECCVEVVKTGKECYMEIQKFIFRLYQFKRFASQVSFRTNQVWDRCSSEVETPFEKTIYGRKKKRQLSLYEKEHHVSTIQKHPYNYNQYELI
ncbi:hypothetical protein YC2023_012866 [Brassica napus]